MYFLIFSGKMVLLDGLLALSTLRILLRGAAADVGDNIRFTSSRKPLQCHEIISISARSPVECSLQCLNNVYSCAGYVFDRMENSTFQCKTCFIYDVSTPLVAVQASDSVVTRMPRIDMGSGKYHFSTGIIYHTD